MFDDFDEAFKRYISSITPLIDAELEEHLRREYKVLYNKRGCRR